MGKRDTNRHSPQNHDKQLDGITLESVLEKRRLDQALNAKEFAVCAGVSYSTARSWFHLAGFPVFHGVVFWQDFVHWRTHHADLPTPPEHSPQNDGAHNASDLPLRAASILFDAR